MTLVVFCQTERICARGCFLPNVTLIDPSTQELFFTLNQLINDVENMMSVDWNYLTFSGTPQPLYNTVVGVQSKNRVG